MNKFPQFIVVLLFFTHFSHAQHVESGYFKSGSTVSYASGTYMQNVGEPSNSYSRSIFSFNAYWDFDSDVWKIKQHGANDVSAIHIPNNPGGFNFIVHPSTGNFQKNLTHAEFLSGTKMSILSNGNIGMGIMTPTEKLHVSGSGLVKSLVESSDNHAYYIVEGAAGKGSFVDFHRKGDGRIWHTGLRNGNNNYEFRLNDQSIVLALKDNGNVGIGTNDPKSKLSVDGQIRSTEVKVLTDINSVPDYVFETDYKLRTLNETKKFIDKNKHLPEIPSAAEIGDNGLDLGDMNLRLLKKIEELTLYLIEQNEEIKELKSVVYALKKENDNNKR